MTRLIVALLLVVVAGDALAQAVVPTTTTVKTSIDYGQAFGWLQPYVVSVVGALLTLLAGWLGELARRWFGIKIDQAQADVYLRAAKNQASSLIADGFVKIKENGRVEVDSPALAAAANDLLKSVPDAAGHFNIQMEGAMKKIVDMVPQVPAAPAVNGVPVQGTFANK